ncbi:GDP-mannose 4,6-dehydratase [Novosphingobium sp. NBM11]|uniref:GDP-mannose 4,6-dehydratase n=1 Tax=Novosphingobium sp. NBM11 TaxID=2596914 RepID=UPI0018926868|nr:GDP-mannose 4,6-dehydratase [Novosphingobium sp. NBM11]MBF5090885.1 GDP-mannose 4,6-dehydratase [Novosphingobium sp. NBM11]
MKKTALITGVTGQDGSYLAELLLEKGYQVHGMIRRSSTVNTWRIDHLLEEQSEDRFSLHYGDLSDANSLRRLIDLTQPDEIYNLAAQSHVRVSFDQPEYTCDATGTGVLRLLEAIRASTQYAPQTIRFYQAGSSEMFGSAKPPQSEDTRFEPRSPYACAKVYGHYQTVNYRESYGMFASNGILFNHESPRRGEMFVTRKITLAAARIKLGLQKKLSLGNLDAKRDWGFAGDYVEAMWRMLQHDRPGDYVVATNKAISIREFLALSFEPLDLDWQDFVEIDERFYRPAEVDYLLGDYSKTERDLGWKPTHDVASLARMMVESDLQLAKREKHHRNFDELEATIGQ